MFNVPPCAMLNLSQNVLGQNSTWKNIIHLWSYCYMVLGHTVCSDCCSTESALCSSAVVQNSKEKMYCCHLVANTAFIITKQWEHICKPFRRNTKLMLELESFCQMYLGYFVIASRFQCKAFLIIKRNHFKLNEKSWMCNCTFIADILMQHLSENKQ